jgi:hypothetical protein
MKAKRRMPPREAPMPIPALVAVVRVLLEVVGDGEGLVEVDGERFGDAVEEEDGFDDVAEVEDEDKFDEVAEVEDGDGFADVAEVEEGGVIVDETDGGEVCIVTGMEAVAVVVTGLSEETEADRSVMEK